MSLTQQDVADLIGKSVDRVSDVEAGKVTVDANLLTQFGLILKFTEPEHGQAFLLSELVPTEAEIQSALRKARPKIDGWHWPAYLLDSRWSLFHANEPALEFFRLAPNDPVIRNRENILKLAFDPGSRLYIAPGTDPRWDAFLRIQVALFRLDNLGRTEERWFIDNWKQLMNYPAFASIWVRLTDKTIRRFANMRNLDNVVRVQFPWDATINGQTAPQDFDVFRNTVVDDNRFCVRLFVPVAEQAEQRELSSTSSHA